MSPADVWQRTRNHPRQPVQKNQYFLSIECQSHNNTTLLQCEIACTQEVL